MMLKAVLSLIYIFLNWLYLPLSRRPIRYYWKTRLDEKLPLVPVMIVPYFSYYLFFLLGSAVLIFSPLWLSWLKTMIITQVVADIFWYFFCNGVRRPLIVKKDIFSRWTARLYRYNPEDANGLPSAHTFHSVIFGWFLAQLFPQLALFIYLWAGLIIVSTVLVKQHYWPDTAAGLVFGLIMLQLGL